MLITRPELKRENGFAIVSAIFILVALAALGAFIAVVSSSQHVGSALDVQGARAYQAARSGTEWGVARALGSVCNATSNIGPIEGFTVTVTCTDPNAPTLGGAVETGFGALYVISATACNFPAVTGSCPGVAGSANYVERRVQVVVER